jgi:hypothetical protein
MKSTRKRVEASPESDRLLREKLSDPPAEDRVDAGGSQKKKL